MYERYLRASLGVAIGSFALSTGAAPTVAQKPSGALLLRAARLFDGERLLTDQAVLVAGDRIVAVGAAGELVTSADVRVLDLAGC